MKKKLTIYQTSDLHGYLYPSNYQNEDEDKNFGLFKLASILDREKDQNEGTSLVIDNGDVLQGSPLSYYVYKNDGKADRLQDAYNKIGFDAGVVGNHEFNYGSDYLRTAVSASHYPILAANILDEEGQPAFGKAYEIVEKDGVKIGILGLTTQYIPHFEHPDHYRGLTFHSAVETAKKYLPTLRQQVDVVVVSYHGGFERDLKTWEPSEELTGENEGAALLEACHQDIDVLLTGHQHNRYASHVDGVPLVMPGHRGSHLAKVTLELEKEDTKWQVVKSSPQLIPVNSQTPVKASLANDFADLDEEVHQWLDQEVGQVVNNDLKINDIHQARLKDHPYIEFINRVQMHFTQTDISGTALFTNDIAGFGQVVTMRDIITNYIYPNTLAVSEITGRDLKEAIEQSFEYYALDDQGQVQISKDWLEPKPKVYNYDIYDGVDYDIDLRLPKGQRLISLRYQGQEVSDDQKLTVALNQYRSVGGGDYSMFSSSQIIREVSRPMNELIAEYMETHQPIVPDFTPNMKVIY